MRHPVSPAAGRYWHLISFPESTRRRLPDVVQVTAEATEKVEADDFDSPE
jgi:hypothetical protein